MADVPTAEQIVQELTALKAMYRYRDLRMDLWHNMWLLRDINQFYKNRGFRRYVTNFPAAVVDKSISVLTRHNWRFWINMEEMPNELDQPAQRELISDVERSFLGLFSYIDRELISQGYAKASRVAAWYALVRGWICSYTMLNTESSPIDHKFLDPRDTYPRWSGKKLAKLYHCATMSAHRVKSYWPDANVDVSFSTPFTVPYTVIEYLDDQVYAVVLAEGVKGARGGSWLVEPVEHGVVGIDKKPIVPAIVLPVNGVPARRMPENIMEGPNNTILSGQNIRHIVNNKPWHSTDGWTAEMGRSIFANIEDAWPLFNEILALTLQIVSNVGLGTVFAQSRSGTWAPNIADFGRGAVVPGRLDDRLSNVGGNAAPVDSRFLLDQLMREVHWGTVSSIIFADTPFQGSGFLFGQMESTALNSLGVFLDGLEQYGRSEAELLRDQFHSGKGKGMSPFVSTIRNSRDKFMLVAVKPERLAELPDYTIGVQLKPGLPDDMLTRVTIARQLLDPRRPIASLRTVFDLILGWDDPDGELERIFEDMAMTDPVIVLERIAQALERRGLPELAVDIREKEFRQRFIEDAQFRMIQAQLGGRPPEGGAAEAPPEVQPPEQRGEGREQQV